jgi:hypothetical protein
MVIVEEERFTRRRKDAKMPCSQTQRSRPARGDSVYRKWLSIPYLFKYSKIFASSRLCVIPHLLSSPIFLGASIPFRDSTRAFEIFGTSFMTEPFKQATHVIIAASRVQQAYDHRLKQQVFQGGSDPLAVARSPIPPSTLAIGKSRPPKLSWFTGKLNCPLLG